MRSTLIQWMMFTSGNAYGLLAAAFLYAVEMAKKCAFLFVLAVIGGLRAAFAVSADAPRGKAPESIPTERSEDCKATSICAVDYDDAGGITSLSYPRDVDAKGDFVRGKTLEGRDLPDALEAARAFRDKALDLKKRWDALTEDAKTAAGTGVVPPHGGPIGGDGLDGGELKIYEIRGGGFYGPKSYKGRGGSGFGSAEGDPAGARYGFFNDRVSAAEAWKGVEEARKRDADSLRTRRPGDTSPDSSIFPNLLKFEHGQRSYSADPQIVGMTHEVQAAIRAAGITMPKSIVHDGKDYSCASNALSDGKFGPCTAAAAAKLKAHYDEVHRAGGSGEDAYAGLTPGYGVDEQALAAARYASSTLGVMRAIAESVRLEARSASLGGTAPVRARVSEPPPAASPAPPMVPPGAQPAAAAADGASRSLVVEAAPAMSLDDSKRAAMKAAFAAALAWAPDARAREMLKAAPEIGRGQSPIGPGDPRAFILPNGEYAIPWFNFNTSRVEHFRTSDPEMALRAASRFLELRKLFKSWDPKTGIFAKNTWRRARMPPSEFLEWQD